MAHSRSASRPRSILIVLGALIGAAIAIWNYVTPLTGVTGTFGAGLVIASSILIALAGIVIQMTEPGAIRTILRVLVALGRLGTAAAAYFLHEWWLIAAMGVVLIGLIYDIASSRGARSKGAYA